MTGVWGAVRRRVLTPSTDETLMATRGFTAKNDEARDLLETVGRTFVAGYGHAAESSVPTDAEVELERIPERFRGFAYEGAGMGFGVRDGLPIGRSDHFARFIEGRAKDHIYMAYVGLGWAFARLPKFRWKRVVVDDPLMRGLVLDGYGFHQAYFRTARYVYQRQQDASFPWPQAGPRWERCVDQGIGRAAWFVGGTDPNVVGDMIDRFPENRHEDLYTGAALAATYAGGVDEGELRTFQERAGQHRAYVAQGAAFAATARVVAGLVVPHTELATKVLCGGITPDQAAEVCVYALPTAADPGGLTPYELWKKNIADALAPGVEEAS